MMSKGSWEVPKEELPELIQARNAAAESLCAAKTVEDESMQHLMWFFKCQEGNLLPLKGRANQKLIRNANGWRVQQLREFDFEAGEYRVGRLRIIGHQDNKWKAMVNIATPGIESYEWVIVDISNIDFASEEEIQIVTNEREKVLSAVRDISGLGRLITEPNVAVS